MTGFGRYLRSFGAPLPSDKHYAQLLGDADAYLGTRQRSYYRYLRVAHEVLLSDENSVAVFPCSVRTTGHFKSGTGLLVATDQRLIHVRAGLTNVPARTLSLQLHDLTSVELLITHPIRIFRMRCTTESQDLLFAFTSRDRDLLPAVRDTMRRLTEAPIKDGWPSREELTGKLDGT